jgi:hypothetical protein
MSGSAWNIAPAGEDVLGTGGHSVEMFLLGYKIQNVEQGRMADSAQ